MTLYIDSRVEFSEPNVVSTVGTWHPALPLLAVGSFTPDKGAFVTIFQDNGRPLEGCEWPTLVANQVTALAWHPSRRLLVVGWSGGELYIWLEGSWARLEAPHAAALVSITFSSGGGRLLTSDAAGSLAGWKSGAGAPLTSFHHQLSEVVRHAAFCAARPTGEGTIRGLARAAVAGDEGALDALAAWRPRTTARVRDGAQLDNHACYAAQENGVIMYIDQSGSCSDVLNAPGMIQFISVVGASHLLVAWESAGALSLTKFIISADGSLTTDMHVRMASRNGQSVILAGGFTIAVIAGEALIRLWDCETGDNDVLPTERDETTQGDVYTSISYCNLSDTLCCGTSSGNLILWRRDPRNQWKLISTSAVKGTVKEVSWGSEGLINPLLHVNCITSVFILREQPVCWGYSSNIWMIQKSANEIAISNKANTTSGINTAITVKALAFKDQYLALTDGGQVQVWSNTKENPLKFSLLHTFSWKTDVLIIYDDVLVGVVSPHIECRTISGNQIGMLPSAEGEGEPIGITSTNRYIVIATMDGCLKIAEVTRKGIRMPYPLKNCYQMLEDFGEVMHASVNCTGRYICLSVANAGLAPDPKIYLWDAANDVVNSFLVAENMMPPYQSVPISIIWDEKDPRLVAVHMRSADRDNIHLFFCYESKLHEHQNWTLEMTDDISTDFILCSVNAPHVVILSQQNIKRITMNEFADIKEPDSATIRQTLDFIFNITIGQLEKAVIVGGNLGGGKSQAVWTGLARACVERRRPDVGAICLTKMGNIKGALMMRKAMDDPDLTDICRVAVLAINLDMLGEAEKLLDEAERPDLLIRMISAKKGGLEELADSVGEGESALLLKNVQHRLAKSLWASGDIGGSIKMFERAGTAVPQVPRMLISIGQTDVLAQHVATSKDENMIRWWGHYLESLGDLDGALETYARIDDYAEQTRLLCHMERVEEAEKICHKNAAATYQMARHLEMKPEQTERAVKLYLSCGAVAAALRVATEASEWALVWRAGCASTAHAAHAASLLENAGQTEQAIKLYQKAGKPHSALKLALASGDTGAVVAAAAALGPRVDSVLAARLAAHLRARNHHAHAAAILATAGQYEEALEIVETEAAPLSEELGEKLAAPAGAAGCDALLRRLADVLGARGLYHQAARRLAQAGDKAGAMRWLLRSGDSERITSFAAASRDRDAQLMAADYLRAHAAWHSRPDLTRHILHFYTRARAHTKLAAFYAQCAALEVDEYENYEKALEALKEAIRCLGKAADPETGAQTIALQEQSTLVKRYMDLKKMLESGEIGAGVTSGQQLLRAVSGQSGLVKEASVLTLLLQYSADRPETAVFSERLNAIRAKPHEEMQSTDSPDQSIEEVI